jgi:hypothetical protein
VKLTLLTDVTTRALYSYLSLHLNMKTNVEISIATILAFIFVCTVKLKQSKTVPQRTTAAQGKEEV